MSEKFRNMAAAPQQAFGRARRHFEKITPKTKRGNLARGAAITMTGLFQFLAWAFNKTVLDNSALRAGERALRDMRVAKNKKGQERQFQLFMKKYPNFSAHIIYYLMFAISIGGVKVFRDLSHGDGGDGKIPTETVVHKTKKNPVAIDTNTVEGMLAAYWNDIAIGLTELETYRKKPVVQKGEHRATNGLGVTYYYTRNKNGKITRRAATEKMPAMSYDENYEQLRMHLEYETLPRVIEATKDVDGITDAQKVALVFAGYQRPADVKRIVKKLRVARTRQQVADAFKEMGNISEKYRNGTMRRRWICAAYATGMITSDDLLNMARDSFSKTNINSIIKDTHFVLTDEVVKYVLSRQNGNNTVFEFLSTFNTGKKILGIAQSHRAAYNAASKKLRNNAHSGYYDVPGFVFDGKEMA